MTNTKTSRHNILRTTALLILIVGTIGSLYFMFIAGSNQKSIVLIGLFTAWVLSPFVGLIFADRYSRQLTENMNIWLYLTMILLTIASLTVYSGIWKLLKTPPAFKFLIIPFLSWLAILIILLIAKRQLRKGNKQI